MWYRLNHPHVVKLYGAWDIGNPAFVCEHPTNGSLDKYLRNSSNKRKAWKKLYEAALGLQYLHERGIVHGDLRCSNILIGGDGAAKLTGFGWSLDSKCAKTSHGENLFAGAEWKAPECFEGEQPTFASDVYSLGMCVVEAVSGETPWSGKEDSSIRILVTRGELPDRIYKFHGVEWNLVECMCAFDPEERLTIPEAVRELHHLGKQEALNATGHTNNNEDDKLKDVVYVDKYRVRECNNIPIIIALKKIREACRQSNTESSMNEDMYTRFEDIYSKLLQQAKPLTRQMLDKYVTLLVRFYKDVKATSRQQQLMNFAASRQRADNSYVLHHDLDRLMQLLKLSTNDPIHYWKLKWESERKQQIQRFADQLNPQTLIQIDANEKNNRTRKQKH